MERTIPRYTVITNKKAKKRKKICSHCGKPYVYRCEVYRDEWGEKHCKHD